MKTFRITGYDRVTKQRAESYVKADSKEDAIKRSGLIVEDVKPHHEAKPILLPQYAGLLYTSRIIRYGAVVLACLYLLSRIVGGYLQFYSDSYGDVVEVTTFDGLLGYLFETAYTLVLLGLLYAAAEVIGAFRDLVINSYKQ